MQNRIGPNRVGPRGWFQPFADVIKLLVKEVVVPTAAHMVLFRIAPMITLIPALTTWLPGVMR
jgi:NADH-quinone oxidoreductase subunit H